MTDSTFHTAEEERRVVVLAALPDVPFDGWSGTTLQKAALRCGFAAGYEEVLFPQGVVEAILLHSAIADTEMLAHMREAELLAMKTTARVRAALLGRLQSQQQNREAIRKGLAVLALPQNAAAGAKALFATVDAVWREVGDRSTDFNYYSKRGLLAGVYASTLLFWLDDESDGQVETAAFFG